MVRFAFLSASLSLLGGAVVVEIADAGQLALDGLHRHLARDLAGGVAAHAVRDDEQPADRRAR